MRSLFAPRPIQLAAILLALLAAIAWSMAARSPDRGQTSPAGGVPSIPAREEMMLDGTAVVVEYAKSVEPQDLGLPSYPGADVRNGFAYTVSTKDGRLVAYYGTVVLVTRDSAQNAASSYAARLPGRPQPDVVEGKYGKRYLLAVGGGREVREVSITAEPSGSRIQLTRVRRPVPPRPRTGREKFI